jgi:uncharacterized protein (TIGR02594 family)
MVSRAKTLLLMSSIAVLAAPAAAQSAQKTHDLSEGATGWTGASAKQRTHHAKPRHAKASRDSQAHSAKPRQAKAGAKRHHVKQHRQNQHVQTHAAHQVTNYEAYLDRHGISQTTYAYVPERARSSNRAVARASASVAARSHSRTAVRTLDPAPTQPHQWGGSIVAEARRYIGTNPTKYSSLWCAHFMNMVLERTGHQGTKSGLARSFASYGKRIPGPQVGAIAVMSRRGPAAGGGPGGHVGVVSGIDSSGNPIIISGNHNKRVAEAVYPRSRIYAYVVPN